MRRLDLRAKRAVLRTMVLVGWLCAAAPAGLAAESAASARALAALKQWLARPESERGPLDRQPLTRAALTAADAAAARELLWADYAALLRQRRSEDARQKRVRVGQHEMKYEFRLFGDKPPGGRSLYISLHGGGNAPPALNDQQWQNQQRLYQPEEGVYLAPRAPSNAWDLWHQAPLDPLLEQLIADLALFQDVNTDRVYVLGYSAGGDGVYQLAPRLADRWAAAAAMAGHPNDASPLGVRNIGLAIHVGANDSAYRRNEVALQWRGKLDELQKADPQGYAHDVQVHEGRGHWMNLEDAVAIPWMARFTRRTAPPRVVWKQDDVVRRHFYWLSVAQQDAKAGTEVTATVDGQRITLSSQSLSRLVVRLRDDLVKLDEPVTIQWNGRPAFQGVVRRTIDVLARTTAERGDAGLVYAAEVELHDQRRAER